MSPFIFPASLKTLMLLIVSTISLLLISCGSSKQPTPEPAAPSVASPSRHWIQDQRLRQVMASLSRSNPSWPKTLPQDPEAKSPPGNAADFDEVAALAASLADASTHIPDLAPTLKMSEADRSGFLVQAMTLHDQAQQLRDAARDRKIEQMQRTMDAINSTCISCHSRYRDFSGVLDSRRAAVDSAAERAAIE